MADSIAELLKKAPAEQGRILDGSEIDDLSKKEKGESGEPNDLSAAEIEAKAKADIIAKEKADKEKADKEKAEKDKSAKPTQEEITALTDKFKKDANSLTEEETKKLVDAGVLTTDDESDKDKIKYDELLAKDATKLSDEEKKFIEEYKANNPDSLITQLKTVLSEKFGAKFDTAKVYTEDSEGTIALVDDVAKQASQSYIKALVDSDPNFKKLFQHYVIEKRSIETFLKTNTTPDFRSIKLEKIADSNDEGKNKAIEEVQRRTIATLYQKRGLGKDEIDSIIHSYEDTGKLFDKAKESLTTLVAEDDADKKALLASEQADIEKEEKDIQDGWKRVESTINKNNYNGFIIPQEDFAGFKAAVLQPINDDGLTKMDVIRQQKLTLDRQVLFDYLLYKDFQVPGLKAAPAKKVALKLKEQKESAKSKGGNPVAGYGSGESSNAPRPNFSLRDLNFSEAKTT